MICFKNTTYTKKAVDKMFEDTTLINAKEQGVINATLDETIKNKTQDNTTAESKAAVDKYVEDKLKAITPDFHKTTFETNCRKIVTNKNTEMETKVNTAVTNDTTTLNGEVDKHTKTLDDKTQEKFSDILDKAQTGANDVETEVTMAIQTIKTILKKYNISPTKPHPLFPNVNAAAAQTKTPSTPPPNYIYAASPSSKDTSAFNIISFYKHFMAAMDTLVHILNFYQQLYT